MNVSKSIIIYQIRILFYSNWQSKDSDVLQKCNRLCVDISYFQNNSCLWVIKKKSLHTLRRTSRKYYLCAAHIQLAHKYMCYTCIKLKYNLNLTYVQLPIICFPPTLIYMYEFLSVCYACHSPITSA